MSVSSSDSRSAPSGGAAKAGAARESAACSSGVDALFLQQQRAATLQQARERRGDLERRHVLLALELLDQAEERLALAGGERFRDALAEAGDALLVDVGHRRQVHRLERRARGALDVAQHVALARRDEQDRLAVAPGTPGAADAVHVGLGVVGHVVVDDVADALHVEAARRDVGRHQDVELAALEAHHGPLAVLLLHVAVECRDREAACLEPLGQFHRRLLGAREHQHGVEGLRLEDARQGVELVHAAHDPVALADVGRGAGAARDRDFDRLAQVPLRDAADRRRQRRREQRDLARGRRLLEDPLDVVDEAHLQHLVGLVEHQAGDAAEIERAALDVVHDAARRADHHVRAALQAHQLRRVALPAVDRQHVEALDLRRVALEGLGDLDRELAGRHQHDALRRAAPHLDAAQHRQREGRGLAGAGLGLAEHVVAGQQHRDGGRLDRRRRFVADLGQRPEHGGTQAEVVERDGRSDGACSHGGLRRAASATARPSGTCPRVPRAPARGPASRPRPVPWLGGGGR